MKEIYKIVMEQFSTSIQRYFGDSRIFEYDKQTEISGRMDYEKFLESKEIKVDPIYIEYKFMLINFKIKPNFVKITSFKITSFKITSFKITSFKITSFKITSFKIESTSAGFEPAPPKGSDF
ncbi:hypothetical protein ACTFIR_008896 [Dictyostelium discoideum]